MSPLIKIRGHTIWKSGLNSKSVVVDAGAHNGEFSLLVTEELGCHCHLIEAHPELSAKLNSPLFASVHPAALAPTDGKVTFIHRPNYECGSIISLAGDANAVTTEIEAISLPSLLKEIKTNHIDVLKLDIEGEEFELIEKTPSEVLSSIAQITVEFHDFLPEFKNRGLFELSRSRLQSLGFICCPITFRAHQMFYF